MMGGLLSTLRPLAYISLPLIGLKYLSTRSLTVRYYYRIGIYLSCLAVVSIWGVCTGIVLLIDGKRFDIDYWTARSFYTLTGWALDWKFEVEGAQWLDTRSAVFVGNHQSMMDVLYIGPIFPRATVITAKKELRWAPFLGLFMIAGGNIFLDRRNPQTAVASLKSAGETCKQRGTSVWIFPEGTRSLHEEPTMKPFKKGAFHVAVQSGLPIVPVVCENYWRIYRTGVFETGTLKIKVLPPIETTGYTTADVADLAVRTREMMVQTLREISAPYNPSLPTEPSKRERDATLMPPPPPPPPNEAKSLGLNEIRPGGRNPKAVGAGPESASRQRTPSLARSVAESDNGSYQSQETEEEDGHVLVRRPR